MTILALMDPYRVHRFTHAKSGCTAIVVINRKFLNPTVRKFTSLGGIRMLEYEDERAAFRDANLLAQAMTKKALGANLDIGGGKTVIIGNPKVHKTEEFLLWLGERLNTLNGAYYGAEDMGMGTSDMDTISRVTKYVTGKSVELGGSGDPSAITAEGVRAGIGIAVFYVPHTKNKIFRDGTIKALSFAIQGLGNVGASLAKNLHREGCALFVADTDSEKTKAFENMPRVTIVPPNSIHAQHVDVFVPCARGGIINDETVLQFNCHIIAGPANNQIGSREAGKRLWTERKILYAPDSVINAGGLINVLFEVEGREPYNQAHALTKAKAMITENLITIFDRAYEENVPPEIVFEYIIKERYEQRVREGTVII